MSVRLRTWIAFVRLISMESTVRLKCGMERGRRTRSTGLEAALSLVRLWLPEVRPCAVALTTLDTKVEVLIPAAAQFRARLAGDWPWLTKFLSHGSLANSNAVEGGRNSSVPAGVRIECVLLPRNCRSWIGDQRSPPVQ